MPSTGVEKGSHESKPACAAIISDASAALRPIGPWTEIGAQPKPRLSDGTVPGEGRKPVTPQKAAGMRKEPPVSDPVPTGSMPSASATAEPPDEPPQIRFGTDRRRGVEGKRGAVRVGPGGSRINKKKNK